MDFIGDVEETTVAGAGGWGFIRLYMGNVD